MKFTYFSRYYTLIVCLLALVLLNLLSQRVFFDPLTAAQNPRLTFQTNDLVQDEGNTFAVGETQLVEAVRNPTFEATPKSFHLLYVGNSQSMAIMDRLPGDLIAAQWLQIFLARQSETTSVPVQVRLGSLPNLTMTEFLVRLVAAGEETSHPVDLLVAGIVLEEWRNVGMRDEVLSQAQLEKTESKLEQLVNQNSDLDFADTTLTSFLQADPSQQANRESSAEPRDSFAMNLEKRLQSWADSYIPLFALRSQLYGWINLKYFDLRNRLLGINSATARPVPAATYRTSLELLELSMRYAESKDIQLVIYLAPIRPVQPNPTLPSDLARFRREVSALCQDYEVTCLDYIDLIPEDLWTNYPDDSPGVRGQKDFAHFTGAAHKLLAKQLLNDIKPLLKDELQAKITP